MSSSAWSRLQRHLVVTAVVVLGAAFLPLAAASAAPNARATQLSGFSTSRASVKVGGVIWDGVTVLPRATRAVTVQYRKAGTRAFHNASTARTTARGAITLGLRPPGAGRWQFRAVVAKTRTATQFVSATRTLVASGHAARTTVGGFETSSASITLGQTVTDDVVVSPHARRTVFVQARRPGTSAFVTQTQGTTAANGHYTAIYRPSSTGSWAFRLVVRASATALGTTTPSRSVAVGAVTTNPGDTTPPGAVTGLHSTSITFTTISLAWTNPTDSDFAGVIVRRAQGNVAPPTRSSGTPVADLSASSTSLTDNNLTAGTPYSYALFAHDSTGNTAPAATITRRTTDTQDVTPPAPATSLTATAGKASVLLTWTNPVDPDFATLVIVRKAGGNPPADVTDGLEVMQLPAGRTSYRDAGDASACLSPNPENPGLEYSYAVFARDEAGNAAAPATDSTTLPGGVNEAELLVNPLGVPSNNVILGVPGNNATVGVPVKFDASCSFAASDITSGTVDFGDNTADGTFTTAIGDNFTGTSREWSLEHTYAAPGLYHVTLTTNRTGGSDTDVVDVHVFNEPTASVALPGSAKVGQPVTVGLGAQTPATTRLTAYDLVFTPDCLSVAGDCASYFHVSEKKAPPATTTVVFDTPGTYTVTLEVENDAGAVSLAPTDFVIVTR